MHSLRALHFIHDFLITGFGFHWALALLATFWLLHLIHLFIKIAFPVWARKLDIKQTKIILHAVEVIGALVLCGVAPVAYISTSDYLMLRYPALLCLPSKEVNFYTLCMPLCVIVGTGVILAAIMFWILHKVCSSYIYSCDRYVVIWLCYP